MTLQATDYLARCGQAFTQAAQQQPIVEHTVQMTGVSFRLRFAGPALPPAVLPALGHLLADDDVAAAPDITFDLWDGASTGSLPPRSLFTAADYRRYGQRAIAYAGPLALMHAPTAGQLFAYDRATRHGFWWTADAGALSIYERAAPLQTLFHWALHEFGWQIVHAAAVGTERGGVLLVGNTGAGKSTTALNCLTGDGLRLLSDDKCLARLDPAPQAFAAFSSGKIKADMLEHLPQFRDRLQGWDDSYKAGKGLVFLYPDYAERLISTFAIKALVIPRVARQAEAAFRSLPLGEAFRVFGPSTVIWLPGAEADNYRFTAALTRRLPCYGLDLALESARNTDAIRGLLETL
ncbi:MAG: hypothetical protein NT169_27810 [Chloroflexi bacterium]|nr:hypothetical protein [Chloroflexota bacterium]